MINHQLGKRKAHALHPPPTYLYYQSYPVSLRFSAVFQFHLPLASTQSQVVAQRDVYTCSSASSPFPLDLCDSINHVDLILHVNTQEYIRLAHRRASRELSYLHGCFIQPHPETRRNTSHSRQNNNNTQIMFGGRTAEQHSQKDQKIPNAKFYASSIKNHPRYPKTTTPLPLT